MRISVEEQVRKVLTARQIPLQDDCIEWDGYSFRLTVRRDVLTVSAQIPLDRDVDEVRAFIRYWHAENYWPRLSYRIDDDAQLTLHADVSADWESGAVDYQIDDMLSMSLAKMREAFREAHA